jgi:hypothetical protein
VVNLRWFFEKKPNKPLTKFLKAKEIKKVYLIQFRTLKSMFKKIHISLFLILFASPSFSANNLKNNENFASFFSKPLTENRMHAFYKNPPKNFLSTVASRDMSDSMNVKNEENLKKLVCFGTENYPDKVGNIFQPYRGSSADSSIPTCDKYDIKNLIPQTKPYFDKLIDLSGSKSFSGTLIHTINKYREIERINISTSQNFIEKMINLKKNDNYEYVKFYLENFWSVQGVWQNEQYKLLQNLKKEVLPYFSDYYKKKFNFDDKKSKLAASFATNSLEWLYLSSFHDEGKDECFLEIPRLGKTHLQKFISNSEIEAEVFLGKNFCGGEKKPSSSEIYSRLLLVAVVDKQSTSTIKKLLNKIDKPDSIFLIESFHQSAPKYPEALELIIKKFPTIVNSKNAFGKTALMYAAQYNNLKSAEILIKNHADVNLATTYESDEVNYDYDLGIDIDISVFDRTALIYAAWQGKPEMIELLVKSNSNKLLRDSKNNSATDYLDKNINLSAEHKSYLSKLLTPSRT